MKKRFLEFLIVFILVNAFAAPIASATSQDEPEVVVEVYVNHYDENYIKGITFDDGAKVSDYNYQIIYMPVPCTYILGDYFDYAGFITRDGEVSLSLDPNDSVRSSWSIADKAWGYLSDKEAGFGANSNWPSTTDGQDCFYWQYKCHFNWANNKDRWNIEPWRTASSYTAVVMAACNP